MSKSILDKLIAGERRNHMVSVLFTLDEKQRLERFCDGQRVVSVVVRKAVAEFLERNEEHEEDAA